MTAPFQTTPNADAAPVRGEVAATLDLGQILRTLWRGKFLIITLMIVMVGLAAYYAQFMTQPTFRASTVLILEGQEPQLVDFESVVSNLSGENDEVNTQIQVLRSRILVGKVVDELNLVSLGMFNPTLRPEGWRQRLRGMARAQYYDLIGEDMPPPQVFSAERQRDSAVTILIGKLEIRNISSSLAFSISIETTDRKLSVAIVDTMAEAYIDDQLEVKASATVRATEWLADRVAELEETVSVAVQNVQDFRSNTNVVSTESLVVLERQMKEMRSRVKELEDSLAFQDADLIVLRSVEDSSREAQEAALDNNDLNQLLPRVADTPSIARAFDVRFSQLLTRAQVNRDRAAAQLAALTQSQQTLELELKTQSEDLIQLEQLEREASAKGVLYDYFLTRLNETSVQQGIQQPDSRIISRAVLPMDPSSPRKNLIVAAAAMLGLLLGATWVMIREIRANGFRTAEDLQQYAGYAVLGEVPKIARHRRRKLLDFLAKQGNSAAAEANRNLRTSLLLTGGATPPQLIVISSSVPGEGKTTQSIALAHNLGALGHKVLLIEGDVRRRVFSEYFKPKGDQGIMAAIEGTVPLADLVVTDPRINADVLMGEAAKINAADVYQSKAFEAFITNIRAEYDHIILDTPPVLAVSDARVIARFSDALLYVVHWDKTTRAQVDAGLSQFEMGGAKVDGLVMTQVDPKGSQRYGYTQRYGTYYG